MWIKARSHVGWQTRSITPGADDTWKYAMWDDFTEMTSDDTLEIWFQTNGVPVDFDDIWVQSGL